MACTGTLQTNADNAGIVFSYRDSANFWVRIWSKATQTIKLYEVSAGTWTEKSSSATTITAGTAFSMIATIRAGSANGYSATIPAGAVGLWCSDSSDNSFDNFYVRDIAGPFEVDGRWFSDVGEVQVDQSNSNVLEFGGTLSLHRHAIRRGFRGEKFVATFKFYWNNSATIGFVPRWVGPGGKAALAARISLRPSTEHAVAAGGGVEPFASGAPAVLKRRKLSWDNWRGGLEAPIERGAIARKRKRKRGD